MAEQTTEKITFRATEEQLEKLDAIVTRKGLKSRSEVIRIAVENYLEENSEQHNSEKVSVQMPVAVLDYLDSMIERGEVLSREDALREAAKAYVKGDQHHYLNEWKQLTLIREEAMTHRVSRTHMTRGD